MHATQTQRGSFTEANPRFYDEQSFGKKSIINAIRKRSPPLCYAAGPLLGLKQSICRWRAKFGRVQVAQEPALILYHERSIFLHAQNFELLQLATI